MGCVLVIFGLFFLVGIGILTYAFVCASRSNAAAEWPTTPGKLTRVEMHQDTDTDNNKTFRVDVEYTYTVDGTAYVGSRVAFGYTASSDHESHDEIYKKLKAAKTVDVRYDPENAGSSVLSFGIHRSIRMMLGFGIVWLVFIGGIIFLFWLSSQGDSVLIDNILVQ
jgi:hypothetical protein